MRTPGYAVDYVRPGALSIPQRYFYFPDRIEPFPPSSVLGQLFLFLEVLSFIPVGFLTVWARRPPVRPIPATLLAAALAVVLAAGKLLFAARREVVADVVMQVAGALLGAVLASRLARARPTGSSGSSAATARRSGPPAPLPLRWPRGLRADGLLRR